MPQPGEPDLEGSVGFVVVILVGHEEQVGRRAEPESIEPDRNAGGKGNAFEEDVAGVELPVAIRIFQDEDAAVAIGGETGPARFIVPIFRDPKAAAIVPAKRHRLGDHRLHGGEFRLKSSGTVIFATACSPVREVAALPSALAMPTSRSPSPDPCIPSTNR